MCVYVFAHGWMGMCVRTYVRVCVCVCVCLVCVCACICVCVCACGNGGRVFEGCAFLCVSVCICLAHCLLYRGGWGRHRMSDNAREGVQDKKCMPVSLSSRETRVFV